MRRTSVRQVFLVFSVPSVFSVRTLFSVLERYAELKFGVPRRSQKGQRQDRLKFGALAAPRRRSQGVSLCPLCVLRVLCAKLLLFFQKPCRTKVRRSQKSQRQDRLKFGALAAPRRRSQGVSLCPLCVLRVLSAKLLLFFQKPCRT